MVLVNDLFKLIDKISKRCINNDNYSRKEIDLFKKETLKIMGDITIVKCTYTEQKQEGIPRL